MRVNLLIGLPSRARGWTILSTAAVALAVALFLMLNLLNPLEIGPNGILVFFFLLYLLAAVMVIMLFKLWRAIFKRGASPVKLMYLASVIAFAPVMLLALNTLNQLEVIDIVLVVLFEGLALFYIFRRLE